MIIVPVINPEFVTVNEPPLSVMIFPTRVKLVPTKVIPVDVVDVISPFKVVVPLPANC